MNRHLGIVCVSALLCTGYSTAGRTAVSGTVTDTQGSPINHALVTYSSESDSTVIFRAVTDSLGQYSISDLPVGIVEDSPQPFSLGQNYPNPFNPSTTIPFTLDAPGLVNLTIYNIMGQTVRTLVDSDFPAGSHNALWDGRDTAGKGVSAGVYLYRLVTNGHSHSRKMLLLDGGGVSGGGYSQNAQKTAKQAAGENALYTITVDRFPFTSIRQEHVAVTAATHDFTMQESNQLVSIPGGTFQMGNVENSSDGTSHEKPVHSVTLTGFEMSIYEITNAQYCNYLNAAKATNDVTVTSFSASGVTGAWSDKEYIYLAGTSSYPDNDCKIVYGNNTFSVKSGYENWPVTWITWYGSKAFANYYGLDLSTESEWEYACRGGHQYEYGTDDGTLNTTKANYWDNEIRHPVAVGSYPANPFGLRDMSGNVWEWCHDWYGAYSSDSIIDPTGTQTGSYRVFRGGSWGPNVYSCRSASRDLGAPYGRPYGSGFRVVRRDGGVIY
jgi:formylglycine-generating enzyme required for sulfatase activity